MAVVAPPNAESDADPECWVFTFKEGLLSAVAHDLKLGVERFSVVPAESGDSVHAEFDAGSVNVISAMRDGKPAPELLNDADKAKIEGEIREKVLRSSRYPRITFASTMVDRIADDLLSIRGRLALCGVEREISLQARKQGNDWLAEATLNQPDFGIRPYTALLGTLKIRPEVQVVVRLARAQA